MSYSICLECGKEFKKSKSNRKFCSIECRKESEYNIKHKHFSNIKCSFCGKIFTPKTSINKYCSSKCRSNSKKTKKEPKKCIICDKYFLPKSKNVKCCSKECSNINKINVRINYCNKLDKQQKKEYMKNWRNKNINRLMEYSNEYSIKNREKIVEKSRKYRRENPEKVRKSRDKSNQNRINKLSENDKNELKNKKKIYDKEYNKKNRETKKKQCQEYYNKNKEKIKHNSKEYAEKNKEKISEYRRNYKQKRRESDIEFKLKANISSRLRLELVKKNFRTFKLIGYSGLDLKLHLESKFKEGMSWDNYNFYGWHIDHIKPVASFKLVKEDGQPDLEQIKLCWSLDNLQPLWHIENASKGSWYEVDGKMCRFSNGEIVEIREDNT